MKYLIALFFGLTAIAAAAFVAVMMTDTYERDVPDTVAGFTQAVLSVAHRETDIPVHIWYPAEQGGTPELIAQNALFFGEHVLRDAEPVSGSHPLVVISHGSGGNGPQLSWLATALAREGAIVVATDHPGTRSRDSDPNQTVQIWNRPQDLTALIDFMTTDAPLGLDVEGESIASFGFSLGGPAALHLAGVQYDKDAFIAYCAEIPDEWDCGWFNENGVDFAAIDGSAYGASYRDARVGAAIAVDSAIARAATPESIAAVDVPVLLINMANEGKVPEAMLSDKLAADLPQADYAVVPKSWHFSMLQECSTFGKFMIATLSSENICGDIEGATRGEIHAEVLGLVIPFLQTHLGLGAAEG